MRFQRVATIDAGLYALGLTPPVLGVYYYLSARCATRFHVSEDEIVAACHLNIKRVRKCIGVLVDLNMLRRWKFPRPKCYEYLVTLSTEKGWGIGLRQAHLIGLRQAHSRGSGKPHHGAQVSPPPVTNDVEDSSRLTVRPNDAQDFAEFKRRFKTWKFNRSEIGRAFHFTAKLDKLALHCIRHLANASLFENYGQLWAFLDDCGAYLAHPHDPLSPKQDRRAHSPAKWLSDWPEQIRLAMLYSDAKAKNITQFDAGEAS